MLKISSATLDRLLEALRVYHPKGLSDARQLFGYYRLDNDALVPLMNEVYSTHWCPLQNRICTSLKLRKQWDGAKTIKKHNTPITPYQRVIDYPDIPETTKQTLQEHHAKLNPFALKAPIEQQTKLIYSLIRVASTVRQYVWDTNAQKTLKNLTLAVRTF